MSIGKVLTALAVLAGAVLIGFGGFEASQNMIHHDNQLIYVGAILGDCMRGIAYAFIGMLLMGFGLVLLVRKRAA